MGTDRSPIKAWLNLSDAEADHPLGRLYPTRMKDLTLLSYTDVLFLG